jgi:hypothetical protein
METPNHPSIQSSIKVTQRNYIIVKIFLIVIIHTHINFTAVWICK